MFDIETPVGEKAPVYKPHHLLTALAWILVIALCACFYVYQAGYLNNIFSTSPTNTSIKAISVSSNAGFLLTNFSYLNGADHEHAHIINVGDGTITPISITSLGHTASPDGRYIVSADSFAQPSGTFGRILMYDTATTKITTFAKDIVGNPQFIHISGDLNQVAYNTLTNTTTLLRSTPSSWTVSVISKSGIARAIAHGLYPHWSPDSKSILYLGDDGLHEYTLASSTDSVVFKLPNKNASKAMMLDVSKNGSVLAWTDPLHAQLMIARITSWHPLTASVEKIIPLTALLPILSPDGSQVAFEGQSSTSTAAGASADISLLNVATSKITTITHILGFNQNTFDMSDWVEHL